MSTNPTRTDPSSDGTTGTPEPADKSRRDFIKAGAAGLAGTTIAAGLVGGCAVSVVHRAVSEKSGLPRL